MGGFIPASLVMAGTRRSQGTQELCGDDRRSHLSSAARKPGGHALANCHGKRSPLARAAGVADGGRRRARAGAAQSGGHRRQLRLPSAVGA